MRGISHGLSRIIEKLPTNTYSQETITHARHTGLGAVHNFIAYALALPTGIITSAFLTRQLGPTNYGILTVTVIIVVWIETAVSLGFSRAALKLVAEADDFNSSPAARILQTQILISLAASLLLVVSAPFLAVLLNDPRLTNTLRFFSIDIPLFGITEILISIMIGQGSYKSSAIIKAIYWLGRMVLIFILVALFPDVTGALLAILGASALAMTCSFFLTRPPIRGRDGFSFQKLWGYTWPLFLYSVGMQLFGILDIVFVKALAPTPQSAGYYAAAKNLAIVPSIFAASFSPLLVSKLTELQKKGHLEIARTLSRQTIRLALCLLPFAGLTAGAAPDLVTAIYGNSFLPSHPILAVLIFGTLGIAMISVSASILIASGHFRWPLAIIFPILTLTSTGQLFLTPSFGGLGSAYVTTLVACLGACSILWITASIYGIIVPISSLFRSLMVCIIVYFFSSFWPTPGVLIVLKFLIVGAAIIFLFILIGEIDRNDFAFFRRLFWRGNDY